jgi:hypothetical protein
VAWKIAITFHDDFGTVIFKLVIMMGAGAPWRIVEVMVGDDRVKTVDATGQWVLTVGSVVSFYGSIDPSYIGTAYDSLDFPGIRGT